MEPALSTNDLQAVESALIRDFLATCPEEAKRIDAAIYISEATGHYLYQRRTSTEPLTYRYKCISPDTLRIAFDNTSIDSGWISPGVVRCGTSIGGRWAVLVIPPAHHTIDLSYAGKITIPLPALALIGLERTYWICAIAGEVFDPSALCYHAPLPNVYDSLKICWGSNTPAIASPQTLPQAWNDFITSPFSNHLIHGKSTSKKCQFDICKQLIALHQNRTKRYPSKTLVPLDQDPTTLDRLITHLLAHE